MRPYSIRDHSIPYFLTWTTVEWVDIFTRQCYRDIVLDSLKYCVANKGLVINAYVVMSNHLHLITRADQGANLSDIIRDCKKFTSKAIVEAIEDKNESRRSWLRSIISYHGQQNRNNQRFQVWQQSNRAIELRDLRRCYQKLAYIHMNPVKAGIVIEPEHYLYSSARNYAGMQALLDITLLEIVPLDGYMRPM